MPYISNTAPMFPNQPTMTFSKLSMSLLPGDTKGSSVSFTTYKEIIGGLECLLSYKSSSQAVPIARQPR